MRVSHRTPNLRTLILRVVFFSVVPLALVACGDAPLASLGSRSSDWVTDPTVSTTTTVATTVVVVRDAANLIWFNDELVPAGETPEDIVASVFARREGDRFIQASRAEIAAVLDGVLFPTRVPPLAEYVTSQLVIENSGLVSDSPSAAFGVWTAEPYTRSRSVGQMLVIRVSADAQTQAELESDGADLSCTRFTDASVVNCEIEEIGGWTTWVLDESSGTTLIFFDGGRRYEIFGRPFAALEGLRQTVASMAPLGPPAGTSDTTPDG